MIPFSETPKSIESSPTQQLKQVLTALKDNYGKKEGMDTSVLFTDVLKLHDLSLRTGKNFTSLTEALGTNPIIQQALEQKIKTAKNETDASNSFQLAKLLGLKVSEKGSGIGRISKGLLVGGTIGVATVAAGVGAITMGQDLIARIAGQTNTVTTPNHDTQVPPSISQEVIQAVVSVDTSKPIPAPESKAEEVDTPKIKAYGLFTTTHPRITDSTTKSLLTVLETQQVLQNIDVIRVLGYSDDGNYSFRFYDETSRKSYDVPIDQVNIARGEVVDKENLPKLPYLGIRNNVSELMPFVHGLGATRVRIVSNNNHPAEIQGQEALRRALQEAQRQDLNILYTFNPSFTPTLTSIRNHLQEVLKNPKVDLEIGNEPDETTNGYWLDYNNTNGNMESYAKFVSVLIKEARRIKPDVRIIIGALANPERNQETLVRLLRDNEKIDLNNIDFSVHTYDMEELDRRMKLVQRATGKRNLIISELGFNGEEGGMLPKMITRARQLGGSEIFIHELPEHEKQWGLVNQKVRKPNNKYYFVQKMVIDEARKQAQSNLHPKM